MKNKFAKLALILGASFLSFGEANTQALQIQQELGKPLIWNPPTRFDKPYEGVLIEHALPKGQVESYCQKLFSWSSGRKVARDNKLLGCAVNRPGFCVIVYIDKPHGFYMPEVIRRHEIGHCNGWSGDHER